MKINPFTLTDSKPKITLAPCLALEGLKRAGELLEQRLKERTNAPTDHASKSESRS